jgi:hypothetical protein
MSAKRITRQRLEAAVSTLVDVSTFADDPPVDGEVRDEIGHVIHVLHELADQGGVR